MQRLANQLPDAFTDSKKVTKSHVPATNALIKIDVPIRHTNEIMTHMKRGRLIGFKDKNPQKKEKRMKMTKSRIL